MQKVSNLDDPRARKLAMRHQHLKSALLVGLEPADICINRTVNNMQTVLSGNMRPADISDNSMTTFHLMLDMVYLQRCCPLQSVAALQNIAN